MTSRKAPYYESRFVRANHPHDARAVWLRSTLLLPRTGQPSADVWAMTFDPDGDGNRAVKQSYPLAAADYGDDWRARIGDVVLDDHRAHGSADESGRHAGWQLDIRPGAEQPVKLLPEYSYRPRFPTAKTLVRHPLARFDGTVEFDDARWELDGWTGSLNHNWGRRHTRAYAFGQVCGFDDAPRSTLEIVTAKAGIGPVRLPAATLFVLRHDGLEHAVRSISGARLTRGSYFPFAWSFAGLADGVDLEGEIRAEPRAVIGLRYRDTNGAVKYCYNSAVATCTVRLYGPHIRDTELTATGRAMFEILGDAPIAGVPLLA